MKRKLVLMLAILCCVVLTVGIFAACNPDNGEQQGTEQSGGETPGGEQPSTPAYSEGLAYRLNSDRQSYMVTGIGECTDTELVIPSEYNGLPVMGIGRSAFYNCSGLTSVTIPDSVTSIDEIAFSGCSGLASIEVDANNTTYASVDGILYNKAKTEFVHIPNAIAGEIEIPNGVTSIGEYAFAYCSGLTSITIPDSVTSIGEYAFAYCSGLTSVTIPDSVTSIGNRAFCDCRKAVIYCETAISPSEWDNEWKDYGCPVIWDCNNNNVGSDGYEYAEINGMRYRLKGRSAQVVGQLPSIPDRIDIPAVVTYGDKTYSVTGIMAYAFAGCVRLTSVTIGNGVTSIDGSAFEDCIGLTSVTIPDSVTSIGDGAFVGCSSLESITLPFVGATKDETIYTCFGGIFDASSYYPFSNNTYVPTSLKEVVITGGTSIGSGAFEGCSGLTSITIPDSVTSIGSSAFEGCSGLTSITIPDSVTSIGSSAFEGCSGVIEVVDGISYVDGWVVDAETGIKTAPIRQGTRGIAYYAFEGCSGLTSVTIGNGVTSIGRGAFYGCSSLESITIPFVGATKDGTSNTHFGCIFGALYDYDNDDYVPTSLKEVVITGGTSIGEYAFRGCSGLTSVTIPDSVTSIGPNAFNGCSGLTSITIPDSVTAA